MTTLKGTHPAAVMAMVYIMTEIQKSGTPSFEYYDTILKGYIAFGFDTKILEAAVDECIRGGRRWQR